MAAGDLATLAAIFCPAESMRLVCIPDYSECAGGLYAKTSRIPTGVVFCNSL